jgi:hypothetical protein
LEQTMLGLGMIGKISTDAVPGTFCQTLASIFMSFSSQHPGLMLTN